MQDATTPPAPAGFAVTEPAGLEVMLDSLLEMAWEPGWAPQMLPRLIGLCAQLREQGERWPAFRAMLRGHAIHRLMQEDALVCHAAQPGISRPRYLDLVLGHAEAAPLLQAMSRAGRELHAVTHSLPWLGALRTRTAWLASLTDSLAELQPGAEILTLRAGHLREAGGVVHLGLIGRWAVLEPDHATRAVLHRGLPDRLSVQSLRGSLRCFARRPFRAGCFDLVCLPRLPEWPAAQQRALLEAAFQVLKPGGRLWVCAAGRPVPEDAWLDAFLDIRRRWAAPQELEALLAGIPAADCAQRAVFPSLDGHLLHALLRRRG